eukprot:3336602-Pleurochrysis_carterae.AAC.1
MKRLKTVIFRPQDSAAASAAAAADNAKVARLELDARRKEAADLRVKVQLLESELRGVKREVDRESVNAKQAMAWKAEADSLRHADAQRRAEHSSRKNVENKLKEVESQLAE